MPNTKLQNSIDFNGQKFYVGLDVHKKSWAVTIRSLGVEVARFTQPPGAEVLAAYLKKNFPGGEYFSAYEAGFCGTASHEQLGRYGINNIIVHAADVPSTDKQRKNKTDVHDSRSIAKRLEKGDLNGIYVMTQDQQELRSLFRLRESTVKDVTRANNKLKGFLHYFSIELPQSIGKKEYLSIKALKWLSNLEMTSIAGTITLQQHIATLVHQRKQLWQVTKLLRQQIQAIHEQTYKCLLSVPGIGAVTAMGLIAEIADFNRFKDPDQYSSFLGLCPWEDSSGDTTKTKGIQPRCNTRLRPLLVEASWMAIRKSPPLFAYYSKHAVRNPKQAITKVARKLAMIAKGVATTQQLYQADYLQNMRDKQQEQNRKTERFFSGITQQHIMKQPNNVTISLPG